MNLLDRIALHKLITTLINFVLGVLKIIFPNKGSTPPKRRSLRRKQNDQ